MSQPATNIIMYGTEWCGQTRMARRIFDQLHIPYQWINIDQDTTAAKYVESVNHGYRSVPTIVFPDGSTLTEPSESVLTKKLQSL